MNALVGQEAKANFSLFRLIGDKFESFRTGCWTARRTAARSRSDNIIG